MGNLNILYFIKTISLTLFIAKDMLYSMEMRTAKIQITPSELQVGDILIINDLRTKRNALDPNSFIMKAQKMQFYFPQGENNVVHASIVVKDPNDNDKLKIADVTKKGAKLSEIKESYPYNIYVYRAKKSAPLLHQASEVAVNTSQNCDISYSIPLTIHSILFPKLVLPHHFNSKQITSANYCSKYIIECIQVAAHKMGNQNIVTDEQKEISKTFKKEKTSSVKSLMDYLMRNEDFSFFIIPSSEEVYITFMNIIRVKTQEIAKGYPLALKRYNELVGVIADNRILEEKEIGHLDVGYIVLTEVLKLIDDKKVKKRFTSIVELKKLGLNKKILSDTRIQEQYYKYFERKNNTDLDLLGTDI